MPIALHDRGALSRLNTYRRGRAVAIVRAACKTQTFKCTSSISQHTTACKQYQGYLFITIVSYDEGHTACILQPQRCNAVNIGRLPKLATFSSSLHPLTFRDFSAVSRDSCMLRSWGQLQTYSACTPLPLSPGKESSSSSGRHRSSTIAGGT
jgi:hypothetical protein